MAISLPGTSDNVLTASLSGISLFPITLICWTKRASYATGRVGGIGNSGNDNHLGWYHTATPSVVARMLVASQADDAAAGTPATGSWVFQAFKYEGHNTIPDATNKLFASIAGTAWGSGTSHGQVPPTINQAVLGRFGNNEVSGHSQLEVAHYAIFLGSLSSAAIAALAGGKNPLDYGPIDYWPLISAMTNAKAGRSAMSYPGGSPTYTTGPTIADPVSAGGRQRGSKCH